MTECMQYSRADRHVLSPYLCPSCWSGLRRCTEMFHSCSFCVKLSVSMSAVFFFFHSIHLFCKHFFKPVTNLLINCEDVSCSLTCALRIILLSFDFFWGFVRTFCFHGFLFQHEAILVFVLKICVKRFWGLEICGSWLFAL